MEAIDKPRLLVIGGTGFIGSHLLAATKDDWRVTSVSINHPSPQRFISSVRYLQLDLSDFNEVKNALDEHYDYVVNLGGYIDHTLFKDGGHELIYTHFIALKNLVSVIPLNSLKRFVHIGSSDEYGTLPAPQHEDLREQAISPYSLAKVASTHLLQMLHRTEGFPSVVLRLFLTYGPYQDENRFLPQIIKACLADDEFLSSEGNQYRDFCYIQDIVAAIILALKTKDIEGQVFNVASGHPVTIRSIIEVVQKYTGGGRPQYGGIAYRPGENMALYANIQKAERMLSWRPKVPFLVGLKQTITSMGYGDG